MEDQVKNDNQAEPLKEDNSSEAVSTTTDTASATIQTKEDTATKSEPVVQAFDAQKNYEALQRNNEQLTKSYSSLRSEFSRRTAYEADLKKQIELMAESLSKATETPIDPEQFIRDLRTHGPKAFEPHFQKWAAPMQQSHEKALTERDSKINNLETQVNLMVRRADPENYPDFKKLEPLMNELVQSDECPVNWNMGIGECIDTLYKLAKDRSADQAIQEAVKIGEKKAEEKLVKEARTAVTGGGKSSGTAVPDLNKITDINKLRELAIQLHGVADRD